MQGRFGLGQAQTSTRLEGEGTGSPCYEVDENGEDDLTKPKVSMGIESIECKSREARQVSEVSEKDKMESCLFGEP